WPLVAPWVHTRLRMQGRARIGARSQMGRVLDRWGGSANMQRRIAELVYMHGLDEHEACHLLLVRIVVQLHYQPHIGVPHPDIGTRDASPGEERVQFPDHVPSRAWQGTRIAPPVACTVVGAHA